MHETYIHYTGQTFGIISVFYVFERSLLRSPRQKFSKIIEIQITILNRHIFKNVIYSCDAKLNFQHHYSSLQCQVILQKSYSKFLTSSL